MTKPQFLIDLERDGYVVVPNVISKEQCKEFQQKAWEWLESFPYGFKRDDKSTWTNEHLPYSTTGGLYNRYSVNHEDFVWKIRTEPAIIKIFEQIWGTEDLIASFDGMNASLPINPKTGRKDISTTKAWPHIDQNPRTVQNFELYQGIANLSPNGPEDGGLCVLKGSHKLHQEYFDHIGGFKLDQDAGVKENGYNYKIDEMDWFEGIGCEEVKVCAGEGDLILWDSRTIHWNASPTGEQTRFVTYVCYCPKTLMSSEELAVKAQIFKDRKGTTHFPYMNRVPAERPGYYNALPRRPDGQLDPANRTRPMNEPEETPLMRKLAGVVV
ncbi:hypothetical protein L486_00686 [Kwoniella mangroviensis CBS 10435]|uniref:Phytanoyl-CoA dioxygenase n=1 Tax=Kwoniella mangroviensis CBS 10435 TaxID=1331196 RepID=A0A1B9IZW4_9TREE|nr:uncharacterized protein I203_04218 [Kwoniella mangroviensis CBS 8507]OCF61042.1 hypothetical protein L486_00686 [Kwoniella mangroviensis CBS 10435]OCF66642.1 hypothetical protein I203_04218 [Kwoniella mangroviensis CBS 8507]OCF74209.1 hypothetical protein I204_04579 [Kwoniella mangroviensis CBS 8886]